MTNYISFNSVAANDGWITDSSQSELNLFRATSTAQRRFADLISIILAKEEQKYRLREITLQTLRMFQSRIKANIEPYFGDMVLTQISSKDILGFVEHLGNQCIKAITIRQYLGLLKRILTLAVLEGWIENLPVFPKVRGKSIPRASLSVDQYLLVLRTAKALSHLSLNSSQITHRNIANNVYVQNGPIPQEMIKLIRFMTNTFLRPVDIKLIQHKHIQIVEGKQCYLRINLPETKRHSGQVVSLRAAVRVYKAIRNEQLKIGYGNPNDFVFFPQISNRSKAIQVISYLFGRVVRAAHLEVSSDGQKRTLYSLRHTAITFRLIYGHGIDLLTLARNARTSVEMIEKFYSSNLKAEMNVNLLQSKRTRRA
jgi:Phage integrase SAM-like domain